MKRTALALLFLCIIFSGFSQKVESLFNGKDLKGWTIFVSDSTVKPTDFFYVKEGVIETPGVPIGYLRTKKEYSNYKLHLEWRYPEKPTNSGIFIHTNGPDKIWPSHYQCQLKHQNAGDFIVHGVNNSAKVKDSIYVSTDDLKPIAIKFERSSEKQPGEWNSCDIVCKGNTVSIELNGVLQNYAVDCSLVKGGIGFQAEGSKIQFRNIRIEKIKESR